MSKKNPSRRERWEDAASRATAALEELVEMQSEFSDWQDNLPENLESSPVAEKLEAVCEIDLESAQEVANEAAEADLPMGFGRD